jgi:hypothetical protein
MIKNEFNEESKGNKNYKLKLKKSMTLGKMFLNPDSENQGLLFGDKNIKQKDKVFKELKLDMGEEVNNKRKEHKGEKNLLKKQDNKIKDLLNNYLDEVLLNEDEIVRNSQEKENLFKKKKSYTSDASQHSESSGDGGLSPIKKIKKGSNKKLAEVDFSIAVKGKFDKDPISKKKSLVSKSLLIIRSQR